MTLGQKIKLLRTKNRLTQKDLSDKVHVSFQTVSKWETDENEPDVATLKELAKLFNCSLDYLLGEEEETKPTQEIKTVVIHQKEKHVCERCHKDIEDNDIAIEQVCVRSGGRGRSAEYRPAYYHKACLAQTQKEREEAAQARKESECRKKKKRCFGWSISVGIITFILFLVVFLVNKDIAGVGGGIGLSVLFGYAMFSSIYCVLSGSYLGSVFVTCASLSIKFPGLIFRWDIDGLIWVITMKVVFAIIGFIIGIFALLFAIALTGTLGIFSFPFVLIHNNKTYYEDAF